MGERVHVVMAADGPYLKGLEVAKASMVESCSDPGRLEFHLFGENAVSPERMRREFRRRADFGPVGATRQEQ